MDAIRLEIPFRVFEDLPPDFQERLRGQMSDWRDGRYPFDVEMIREGVLRVIRNAGITAVITNEVLCSVIAHPTT